MPIAAALPLINSQLNNALSLGPAAQPSLVATMIASAVAQAAPMGLFPMAPSPIPLIPAGLAAGQNLINNALSLGPAAQPGLVATMIASGISLIAPMAPPAGLSFLQSQIESALSMGQAAQEPVIATMISSAIITYYTMGGIL